MQTRTNGREWPPCFTVIKVGFIREGFYSWYQWKCSITVSVIPTIPLSHSQVFLGMGTRPLGTLCTMYTSIVPTSFKLLLLDQLKIISHGPTGNSFYLTVAQAKYYSLIQ